MMPHEPSSAYKKMVFVFFLLAARRGTHTTKAAAAAAASEVALAVARAATTPRPGFGHSEDYRDRRCIAQAPLLGRSKAHSSFSSPTLLFCSDGCSARSLLIFCQFFQAGVANSFKVPSFYILLANHSAVSQPHPTKGAEIYCCIHAGGILAATEVCCAGCTPLCAGRCARCLFVLLSWPS